MEFGVWGSGFGVWESQSVVFTQDPPPPPPPPPAGPADSPDVP